MVIWYFLLPHDKCQCSVLPPLLQCHQEMRHTENYRKKVCCEPDTLVPQVCRALCELEVSRYHLCVSSTKLQKQLWPLLHNSFLYIKGNSEWVRNREREYGKRAVMFQEESGDGSQLCRLEQFVQLSLHIPTLAAHTEMVSCCTQLKARKEPWKHQGGQ